MKIRRQTSQTFPNSLTENVREVKRAARDNGTLQGWWQSGIGDVRDLLGIAKRGDDVVGNLDRAYAILKHLRLIAQDRVRYGCPCEGSKALEQSLSRLHANLHNAMMDILLAKAVAASTWGRTNPLTSQIASALRLVPTPAEIGKLAPELGHVAMTDNIAMPMVRQGAPLGCRFCNALGQPD